MSNFREVTPQWLNKKFQTFKNMNTFYIALKHTIWRFRNICEISKFHEFTNTLRNLAKSVSAHTFEKFKYFAKHLTESADHMFYNDI